MYIKSSIFNFHQIVPPSPIVHTLRNTMMNIALNDLPQEYLTCHIQRNNWHKLNTTNLALIRRHPVERPLNSINQERFSRNEWTKQISSTKVVGRIFFFGQLSRYLPHDNKEVISKIVCLIPISGQALYSHFDPRIMSGSHIGSIHSVDGSYCCMSPRKSCGCHELIT